MNDPRRDNRKRLLDDARRALKAADAKQMRAALERLPASGTKANALRSELRSRLAGGRGRSVLTLPLPLPRRTPGSIFSAAVETTLGLKYRFEIVHTGLSTLFRVRPQGGVVEIVINASHPAFPLLAVPAGDDLNHVAANALIAWATLHLEAGSDKKRERVDDLATEWGRALGTLYAEPRRGDESMG